MKMEFIFIGLLLHVSLWPALKIRAIPALLGLHYSAWTHQRWSEKHWEANTTSILNSPTGGIQGDRQSWPLRNVNLQSLPQDPYIPPRQFPSPKSGTAGPRHLQGLLLALTPLSVRANKTEAPPPTSKPLCTVSGDGDRILLPMLLIARMGDIHQGRVSIGSS